MNFVLQILRPHIKMYYYLKEKKNGKEHVIYLDKVGIIGNLLKMYPLLHTW